MRMQWKQSGEHPHLVANIKHHWGILTKVKGILPPKNIYRLIPIVIGCGNHLNLKILVSKFVPRDLKGRRTWDREGRPGQPREEWHTPDLEGRHTLDLEAPLLSNI